MTNYRFAYLVVAVSVKKLEIIIHRRMPSIVIRMSVVVIIHRRIFTLFATIWFLKLIILVFLSDEHRRRLVQTLSFACRR